MAKPKTRHVWVRPPNLPVEHQAFLLEWRQTETGDWFARVLWVDHEYREVMDWVSAERVRPVGSQAQIGSAYG